MPFMKSLNKFFKGKSCGCLSTSTSAKRNHTRKRKRNVKRRYRGGFKYSSKKNSDIVFSSNSTRRRSKNKTRTHSN